jgi:AcrR family transcriptional regulator
VPRAKLRTPELRERLVASALHVLTADGAVAVTARRVAQQAQTSPPAVYELFGDKGGLVREVFFEGWRLLGERLSALEATGDPVADLRDLAAAYRRFLLTYPALGEVMLGRPFTDFDPVPHESAAGAAVRRQVVGAVSRCTAAGLIGGDPTDVAHVFVALLQGLAASENARRLGTSAANVDRRWQLALDALLVGLAPRGNT